MLRIELYEQRPSKIFHIAFSKEKISQYHYKTLWPGHNFSHDCDNTGGGGGGGGHACEESDGIAF